MCCLWPCVTPSSKHGAEVSAGALPALGTLEGFLGLEAAGLSPDRIVRAALGGEEGKAWRPRNHAPGWKAELGGRCGQEKAGWPVGGRPGRLSETGEGVRGHPGWTAERNPLMTLEGPGIVTATLCSEGHPGNCLVQCKDTYMCACVPMCVLPFPVRLVFTCI